MENLDPFQFESHLSRIETRWSLVFQAHGGDDQAADSLRLLMLRYGGSSNVTCWPRSKTPTTPRNSVRGFRGSVPPR